MNGDNSYSNKLCEFPVKIIENKLCNVPQQPQPLIYCFSLNKMILFINVDY